MQEMKLRKAEGDNYAESEQQGQDDFRDTDVIITLDSFLKKFPIGDGTAN